MGKTYTDTTHRQYGQRDKTIHQYYVLYTFKFCILNTSYLLMSPLIINLETNLAYKIILLHLKFKKKNKQTNPG